ncbi:hypothetical protein ACIBQ6_13290 [Nonomuraea sp. NPDC049655]|uniref:hypothetical protein n=1 Tax=Nonomuraea sp. NPDC049655 TaxID=3364355 RepID=UPI00378A0952
MVSTGRFFCLPWGIAVEPGGSILVSDHEAFGHKGGGIHVHPQTRKHMTVTLPSPLMVALVPHDQRRIRPLSPAMSGGVVAR